MVELGVIRIAMEMNVRFTEDMAKRKYLDDNGRGPRTESRGTHGNGNGLDLKDFSWTN